jgi:hypothetical protein
VDQGGTNLPAMLSRALSIIPGQCSRQWHHSSVQKAPGCRSECWQAGENSSCIGNHNDTIHKAYTRHITIGLGKPIVTNTKETNGDG